MVRLCATVACLAVALGSIPSPSFAAVQKVATAKSGSAMKSGAAAKPKKPVKTAKPAAETLPPEEPATPLPEAAAEVVNWVTASGDNGGLPFMVIDKVSAEVIVFDGEGKRRGSTPALLGVTPGDDSSPGVGDRELSDIAPEERTTPAGRFVSRFGLAYGNKRVLWVDYVTSISLHPVITTNKRERRPQRLASPSPEDNRITFGCINVPPRFYSKVVVPLFKRGIGVVYILPEIKTLAEAFPAFRPQQQLTAAEAFGPR